MFVCPVPKISQVMMPDGPSELYIVVDLLCGTSTAAELHIEVDLLCGTTAADLLHNSVDLLCGTTVVELHNSVDLLCGTTATELNNPVSLSHTFSKDNFGRFNKHRSIVDLQETFEICTRCKDRDK